jgi:hypothetical protein
MYIGRHKESKEMIINIRFQQWHTLHRSSPRIGRSKGQAPINLGKRPAELYAMIMRGGLQMAVGGVYPQPIATMPQR